MHLDVGLAVAQVVQAREGLAYGAVAFFVVDGVDFDMGFAVVVHDGEQFQVADDFGR